MVQSLEIRFAFCVRLTNNDNFLADKRADGGKVLKDNVWEKKKKAMGSLRERLGLLGVLCVAFFEVTQVHWCESCKNEKETSS